MHWQTIHWVAGVILALAWFSRIVEAAVGMPHVPDISKPEWMRGARPTEEDPKVSIIVPARNEQEDIRATLKNLL